MNKSNPNFRFINDMSNIGYLTGFVRNPGKDFFFLQQNNNTDQMVKVMTRSNMRIPADRTPVTVLAHIFGEIDANGAQNAVVRAFDIQKPSVRSMPPLTTWFKGVGHSVGAADDFHPFAKGEGRKSAPKIEEGEDSALLKADVAAQVQEGDGFSDGEQILRDILEATKGRLDTRLGENANVVHLAGFVDSMRWVEPNEYQENGYGLIMLRQHKDPERNIPVRLHSPAAKLIMKNFSVGLPVSLVGQIRMKTIPDDKTGGKIQNLHLRVSEVYSAESGKDIKEIPEWFTSIRDRLMEEFRIRKSAKENGRKMQEEAEMARKEIAAAEAMSL